jgi:hypothetical protein
MVIAGLGTELNGRSQWSAVLALHPTSYSNYPIVVTTPTNAIWNWILEYDANCQFYVGSGNGHYRVFRPSPVPPAPGWTLFSIVAQPSGAAAWVNKAPVPSYGLGPNGDLVYPVPTTDADAVLGTYYESSYAFSGYMAELLLYDHALTTAERQQLENYLQSKWGI